jgi:hypothetical protein
MHSTDNKVGDDGAKALADGLGSVLRPLYLSMYPIYFHIF